MISMISGLQLKHHKGQLKMIGDEQNLKKNTGESTQEKMP